MDDDAPVTRREFAAAFQVLSDKLDKLNGSVAENTKFRVQQKAVYTVIAMAWGTVLIPLTAIAVTVL